MIIHSVDVLKDKKVFISCAACLTTYTETLKYLNYEYYRNGIFEIVVLPELADVIIVLGCQVTDLAIYNDISIANSYFKKYPDKKIYIGGCLAQRVDIDFKYDRIEHLIKLDSIIRRRDLIYWEKPYWISDSDYYYNKNIVTLYNNSNYVQVSRGCHGKCAYCTINKTRGVKEDVDNSVIGEDFLRQYNDNGGDTVVVADSLSYDHILYMAKLSIKNNAPISLRNVEPFNFIKSFNIIDNLANRGLLTLIHSPIQSIFDDILILMKRSVSDMKEVLGLFKILKKKNVKIATNVIIDYVDTIQDRGQIVQLKKRYQFDHVSYNPFWNGIWDFDVAANRYDKYILNSVKDENGFFIHFPV